ncbi:MAG TPA: metallophosphoesterase [Polyangiaceae bacterium]
MFGDNRSGDYHIRQPETFRAILAAIKARGPRLIIGTGDQIQGYQYNEALLRREWKAYFEALAMVKPVPVHQVVGNHDLFDETSGRVWDDVMGPKRRYYAVEVERSAFLFLDTETLVDRVAGAQLKWLNAELEKYQGWDNRFVFLHKPVFRPYLNGKLQDWAQTLDYQYKAEWEALVKTLAGRVTAVFAGHYHLYDKDSRYGIQQYITGGGGSEMGLHDPAKEFYHFLSVSVDGKKVDVELIRPDLSNVREPIQQTTAPAVLEDFESDDAPTAWSSWNERVRIQAQNPPEGGKGRALALRYEFSDYQWPSLYLGLEPVQKWIAAKAVSFDAYVPPGTQPGEIALRVGARQKGYTSPDGPLNSGWNHLTFPFSRRTWTWAEGKGSEERKQERVVLDLRRIEAVSVVSVTLSGHERKESGTVWYDNFRIE